jgi:hypothetical protein
MAVKDFNRELSQQHSRRNVRFHGDETDDSFSKSVRFLELATIFKRFGSNPVSVWHCERDNPAATPGKRRIKFPTEKARLA